MSKIYHGMVQGGQMTLKEGVVLPDGALFYLVLADKVTPTAPDETSENAPSQQRPHTDELHDQEIETLLDINFLPDVPI